MSSDQKGFTLIEIIVVMIIVGLLAIIAIPNYTNMMYQGEAKAAQNNLIAIYNAQKNYYLSSTGNGTYYNSLSANDIAGINNATTGLSLNINDSNFQYTCVAVAAPPSYTCTATNISGSGIVLTLTGGSGTQIVLPNGVGCTSGNMGSCNPSCAPANSPLCPS